MNLSSKITASILGIALTAQVIFIIAINWSIDGNEVDQKLDSYLLVSSLIITILALANVFMLRIALNRYLKKKNDELKFQAIHDKLTGLPNRTLLFDRIDQALTRADRNNSSFALLVLDLDNFKEINDTMGHYFGDQILIQISKNLRLSLRDSDSICRLGGDEFAILLNDTDEEGTNVCVTRISNKLKTPVEIEGTLIESRASIGCAIYPQHGEDAKSLLKHAEIAMYQSKKSHNNYVIYDPIQDSYSVRNLALMNELRKAVEDKQIIAHYHPMIDQKTNTTIAVEALARWDHDTLGVISPGEFIQIAERIGIIQKLTFLILDQSLKAIKTWFEKDLDISISINISTNCLQEYSFTEKLHEIVKEAGIPANRINLEITESAIMQNLESAKTILNQLHNAGFIISIDDFGTGFSSMSHLKELPVDILKIDKSFVLDIENKKSEAIVRSIIELAHNLNCKVIAEGIESEKTLGRLREIDNDIAQGYLFSRPLPIDELTLWLEKSTWPAIKDSQTR